MATKNAKRIFDNTKHLLPIGLDKLVNGLGCSFDYNETFRAGVIEKSGTGKNGVWFTIKQHDGSYRCFTLAKCNNLNVNSI